MKYDVLFEYDEIVNNNTRRFWLTRGKTEMVPKAKSRKIKISIMA
jgi:hypothetical protein